MSRDLSAELQKDPLNQLKFLGTMRKLGIHIDLSNELERQNLKDSLKTLIIQTIDQAPTYGYDDSEGRKEYPMESSISFEVPGEMHVLMLFEKMLFEYLLEQRKKQTSDSLQISNQTLMHIDPKFPQTKIVSDYYGQRGIVGGETIFEHELAHVVESRHRGEKYIFVIFTFQKIKSDDGLIHLEVKAIVKTPPKLEANVDDQVGVLLAPRVPSLVDIEGAQDLLGGDSRLPSESQSRELENMFIATWSDTRAAELGII